MAQENSYEEKKAEIKEEYGYEDNHPYCKMLIGMTEAKLLFDKLEALAKAEGERVERERWDKLCCYEHKDINKLFADREKSGKKQGKQETLNKVVGIVEKMIKEYNTKIDNYIKEFSKNLYQRNTKNGEIARLEIKKEALDELLKQLGELEARRGYEFF